VCVEDQVSFRILEDAHAKNSWQVMRSANFGVNGKGFLSLQRLLYWIDQSLRFIVHHLRKFLHLCLCHGADYVDPMLGLDLFGEA